MPVDRQGYWVPPATVDPHEVHKPHPPEYTYQDPIPAATTQTPGELLSAYYSDWTNVRDWTDPKGVLPIQQAMHRYYPEYAIKPIGSTGLVGKWPRPGGLRAVPVPIYGAGSLPDQPETTVEFRTQDPKCHSTGICAADIFGGGPGPLEGASDIVLDRLRGMNLNFIIAWPGYRLERSTIHTRRTDGAPLSRFDLGKQIISAYDRFFRKVEDGCLFPRRLGFYNIALHQGANSKDDSLGVQLMQLHLVRFCDTIDGYWAAEIDIV